MSEVRPTDQHDDCEKCGKPVYGWIEERCCSGHECGCMGLPITPCWCVECWAAYDAEARARAAKPLVLEPS